MLTSLSPFSGLTGGGFRIKDASNVIIRNLNFGVPTSSGDALALDGATKVWIGMSRWMLT